MITHKTTSRTTRRAATIGVLAALAITLCAANAAEAGFLYSRATLQVTDLTLSNNDNTPTLSSTGSLISAELGDLSAAPAGALDPAETVVGDAGGAQGENLFSSSTAPDTLEFSRVDSAITGASPLAGSSRDYGGVAEVSLLSEGRGSATATQLDTQLSFNLGGGGDSMTLSFDYEYDLEVNQAGGFSGISFATARTTATATLIGGGAFLQADLSPLNQSLNTANDGAASASSGGPVAFSHTYENLVPGDYSLLISFAQFAEVQSFVPEPSTFFMAFSGLIGLMVMGGTRPSRK